MQPAVLTSFIAGLAVPVNGLAVPAAYGPPRLPAPREMPAQLGPDISSTAGISVLIPADHAALMQVGEGHYKVRDAAAVS
ncbi:hypothetical protein PspLS_01368 [Pyricularia sp. CBS 133598]|nr:hypothetical protein PspLS_01368 [Pyricularia sp. CBS 133598]